jgi:hypothetical protein
MRLLVIPIHHCLRHSRSDVKPSADAFETRAAVVKARQGHVLGRAVYGGLFRRPQ